MSDPTVGGGRVPITLDGKEFELVPSLGACTEISGAAGGIQGAVQRCMQLNFDTICMVVGAGLEMSGQRLNPSQRAKMLPEAIYKAGLIDVSALCVAFCHIVANGGREPTDEDFEEEDAEEGDNGGPLGFPTQSSTPDSSSE